MTTIGWRLGLVEGAVVERANLPVVATGIGDANEHAVRGEERIELLFEFVRRQRAAWRRPLVLRRLRRRPAASPGLNGRRRVHLRDHVASSRRSGAGLNVTGTDSRSVHEDDLSLEVAFNDSRCAASSSRVGCRGNVICTAAPFTAPLVPGVQASTSATSVSFTGETM